MKYLQALLESAKNSPHAYSTVTTKPTKPVSSVLSLPYSRSTGEILPPGEPPPFFTDSRETIPAGCVWDDGADVDPNVWLCPHCGQAASIDDVFPSLDGERTLTMWSCEPCQVVGVTTETIRQPPSGWVKKTIQ